jgi:hypothetical protein
MCCPADRNSRSQLKLQSGQTPETWSPIGLFLPIWAISTGLWLKDEQNNLQHIAETSHRVGGISEAKKRKEDNG